MRVTMDSPPPPNTPSSNRQVKTVRGQHHKFMLIPLMEHHTRWFDAGPVSIAVEARALGDDPARMVRGPSIHVFSADHEDEYLRFDIFGREFHYHYILNDLNHNVVWGYDTGANGPMVPWVIASLRDRLPALLREAHAYDLARQIDECGWDKSVLADVEQAASAALAPRDDDMVRARQGMDWMYAWKRAHPQFNTVEEGEY